MICLQPSFLVLSFNYVYVGAKQTKLRLSMVLGKTLDVTGETGNY
jgi:hypothetical protein